MTVIHLEGRDILPCLRGNYTGNKFKVEVCETVTIPADAGLWSGGSRNLYHGVDMLTGQQFPLSFSNASPWNSERKEIEVKLEPGKAVVESIMFCGKDLGLRIYLHPDNATKLIPADTSSQLTELEHVVLNATCSLKSSYNGKDRYQMTYDYDRSMRREVPTREMWDAAKVSLIAKGLLDKRGAVTIKGRNARKR